MRGRWEKDIRRQDEKIERLKQELETTATDDNDSGGEQGIVMKCGHSYIQQKIQTSSHTPLQYLSSLVKYKKRLIKSRNVKHYNEKH